MYGVTMVDEGGPDGTRRKASVISAAVRPLRSRNERFASSDEPVTCARGARIALNKGGYGLHVRVVQGSKARSALEPTH